MLIAYGLISSPISRRQQVSTLLLKTLFLIVHRLLVYKRILFDLVYISTECSGFTNWMAWRALLTHQMDKKESMGLVGFEDPLRGEKKLLLEQENLDSMLSYIWKCEYWKWRRNSRKILHFWNLAIQNGKMDGDWIDQSKCTLSPPITFTIIILTEFKELFLPLYFTLSSVRVWQVIFQTILFMPPNNVFVEKVAFPSSKRFEWSCSSLQSNRNLIKTCF